MQRTRTGLAGGFQSLISTSKDLLGGRKLGVSANSVLSMARFRGKLGAAIAVITSLIVGFLTLPNNVLYLIDSSHAATGGGGGGGARAASGEKADYGYAYVHAGIAVVTLGCLAMVVSVVLSYFAAKSKRKMDDYESEDGSRGSNGSTRTVLACLVMMNVELFMSVIAGCMELLYRPLIRDAGRMHSMETAIAVFNIIIYAMYAVTMILKSTVLREKRECRRSNCEPANSSRDGHVQNARPYGDAYYSQSGMYL